MTTAAELLDLLPGMGNMVAHIERLPAREPVYGTFQATLPGPVARYLDERKIRLYSHQAEAIDLLRRGRNVVITTATASGKTLAFNIPVFASLAEDPAATALYLYPTKALANDQLQRLLELDAATGIKGRPAVYDGDTPQERRQRIRDTARIIVSNPHEIHRVLAWRANWARLLRNLKYVVLDEAHQYRGVFGSNVAMLIRRVRRLCAAYGAHPQFVVATATMANAAEFSERLVGLDVEVVDKDGSGRGKKHFVFMNPHGDTADTGSTHQVVRKVFGSMVAGGIQTLCFTPTRRLAELLARWTQDDVESARPVLAGRIGSYRAGYTPQERRTIEAELRNGTLTGVATTNALEVGIDIGSLDCVVMDGYPGTITSTWQQAGRAGRGTEEALAILVAGESQLDQYMVKHPDLILTQRGEAAVVDLENPYILEGHLLCATAEAPLRRDECRTYFGAESVDLMSALERKGLVGETSRGWQFSGTGQPAAGISLNGTGSESFKVMANGMLIETMDRVHAFSAAHKGAVLLHLGETYLVRELDLETETVYADRVDVDYYTDSVALKEIRIASEEECLRRGRLDLHHGRVRASTQYVGYKVKKFDTVVRRESLDLPPLDFETRGLWFTVPDELQEVVWKVRQNDADVQERLTREGEEALRGTIFAGSLHAVEHAMIGVMPIAIMCEKDDMGGVSTLAHPDTGAATIFIYDGFPGGIGLSEKATSVIRDLMIATRELIAGCPCESETGCPRCTWSYHCGNDNRPMDKKGAVLVLDELIASVDT